MWKKKGKGKGEGEGEEAEGGGEGAGGTEGADTLHVEEWTSMRASTMRERRMPTQ